jgi:ketosteroid isomerase-like protein
MKYSRRSAMAIGAAALATQATSAETRASAEEIDHTVADLIARSERANAALMRGDIDTYLDLMTLSDDFTLMSPFGGKPSLGAYTRGQWEEIGKFFKNGTLKQELVQAYGTSDMVVLAVIEHCHGEVGGLPAQDWPLRVTLVYRRDADKWHLVHRHADALSKGITLKQAAEFAMGGKG